MSMNRRELLKSGISAGLMATGFHTFPVQATHALAPNERLNIAAIGARGRAGANIAAVSSQNIIAVADVDANLLGKGCEQYPDARQYRDFRVMLEKEADNIDAVLVGTPDHTHAPAAAMAMRMKKHVYCEKPLTHTVYEARRLAELARENQLVTQMGTQIHAGDNYRRVVELVQSGAIGNIRNVHVWMGVDYSGRTFVTGMPLPKKLDWDLWLGPTAERPYCESEVEGKREPVHPFNWRYFWDFGAGGLGDFGCHYLDLVHWALKLRSPTRIAATGPPPDAEAAATDLVVEYQYPARKDLPAVTVTWYDGSKRPELLSTLTDGEGKPLDWRGGQLFVGEEGMIVSDYSQYLLLPHEKFADFAAPEPWIPKSIGHHNEWIKAIKSGGVTTCNFDYGGRLTESVLLGVVAYRSGVPIEWDGEACKITNSPQAQSLLHTEYRKGWTI